ncbi:unnamed protein product, partial [Tilletia caries]
TLLSASRNEEYSIPKVNEEARDSSKFFVSFGGDRIGRGNFVTTFLNVEAGTRGIARVDDFLWTADGLLDMTVTNFEFETDVSGLEPVILREVGQSAGVVASTSIDRKLNVAHDCSHHGCQVDIQATHVRMERESIEEYKPALVHCLAGAQRYLLNHCLFRSASSLASLYPKVPNPPTVKEIANIALLVLGGADVDEDSEEDELFSEDDDE